ncbi:MAG: putative RNA methylase [Rhodospirillaceae bacterium]|nr:MAG: putative RNA methylase [Rhodospirillaceae bacterium]
MTDLTHRDTHFAFGANGANFALAIDEDRIREAVNSLRDLVGGDLEGQNFFDIGCGSGLSALAALRLGVARLRVCDLYETAVATTRALLDRHARDAAWSADVASVFDLDPHRDGVYDVVHSWGVLHHTGDMARAIRTAAALVAPQGRCVLAIYQRTPACGFWRWEKRLYSRAPAWLAVGLRGLYKTAFCAGFIARGRNPWRYIAAYQRNRGMRWSNDVHDWLGGYPYESATIEDLDTLMMGLGFKRERLLPVARSRGWLGSWCNQYVYHRLPPS